MENEESKMSPRERDLKKYCLEKAIEVMTSPGVTFMTEIGADTVHIAEKFEKYLTGENK